MSVLVAGLLFCAMPRPASADEWWGPDKAAHFGVGTGLGGVSYGGLWTIDLGPRWLRYLIANAAGTVPAVAKELYDGSKANNYFSGRDLFWSWVGVALGSAVVLAVDVATH